MQISFTVTAKLISVFVFATRIVQFLFYINTKFQASSSFLCLHCSETTLLVFPQGGSFFFFYFRQQGQLPPPPKKSHGRNLSGQYRAMSTDGQPLQPVPAPLQQVKLCQVLRKPDFSLGENKGTDQMCSKLTAQLQLINTFIFATHIVQSLFFVHTKFQASSVHLSLYKAGLYWTWSENLTTSFLEFCFSCLALIPSNEKII